jgi:hypothetical protein
MLKTSHELTRIFTKTNYSLRVLFNFMNLNIRVYSCQFVANNLKANIDSIPQKFNR